MGAFDIQSLSLADVPELSSGILNRKINSNPARSVTHRREDNNNRVRFLTVEEEKKLRNVIEAKWSSIRSDVGHGRL